MFPRRDGHRVGGDRHRVGAQALCFAGDFRGQRQLRLHEGRLWLTSVYNGTRPSEWGLTCEPVGQADAWPKYRPPPTILVGVYRAAGYSKLGGRASDRQNHLSIPGVRQIGQKRVPDPAAQAEVTAKTANLPALVEAHSLLGFAALECIEDFGITIIPLWLPLACTLLYPCRRLANPDRHARRLAAFARRSWRPR
jgi:hypothetical protein